jgi:Na+/melibiose symporter-like transporter
VREHPPLQAYLVANALWELSLATLKTFVVLYVTNGLGYGRSTAALMLGGVAVIVLLAALASVKLADRYGPLAVLRSALPVYGIGFLVPLLFSAPAVVALAGTFGDTQGYQAIWGVCALGALLSLIPLRRLRAAEE